MDKFCEKLVIRTIVPKSLASINPAASILKKSKFKFIQLETANIFRFPPTMEKPFKQNYH